MTNLTLREEYNGFLKEFTGYNVVIHLFPTLNDYISYREERAYKSVSDFIHDEFEVYYI